MLLNPVYSRIQIFVIRLEEGEIFRRKRLVRRVAPFFKRILPSDPEGIVLASIELPVFKSHMQNISEYSVKDITRPRPGRSMHPCIPPPANQERKRSAAWARGERRVCEAREVRHSGFV